MHHFASLISRLRPLPHYLGGSDHHYLCNRYLDQSILKESEGNTVDWITGRKFVNGPQSIQLQLLRACRQTYLEATPILWNTNIFSFITKRAYQCFYTWFAGRTSFQKKHIKSLHLYMIWNGDNHHTLWSRALAKSRIKNLTGLRTLHFQIEQGCLPTKNVRAESDCGTAESAKLAAAQELRESWSQELLRLKVLPLEHVTVIVCDSRDGNKTDFKWTHDETREFAEELRVRLLSPSSSESR